MNRTIVLTLDDFMNRVQAPILDVLEVLYRIVRDRVITDRWAIINLPCSEVEINEAEQRIGHPLHPLHRFLLKQSNGGTIPFVTSVSLMFAAVPREQEWRIMGPLVSTAERTDQPIITARQIQPIRPQIIGQPLFEAVDEGADESGASNLITFAAGFGGQQWGYVRGEPERIDVFLPGFGRGIQAQDFERFIREQLLSEDCASADFAEHVRSLMRQS